MKILSLELLLDLFVFTDSVFGSIQVDVPVFLLYHYSHFDDINNKLGIKLFIGKNIFKETKKVQNRDYLKYYQSKSPIEYNLNFVYDYFQTREISNILYNHLHLNKMNI